MHFYKVFTAIKKQFPGLDHGNRCGHQKNFKTLPAVTLNNQSIKRPRFIAKAEKAVHRFFSQHYKSIYAKSPHLQVAVGSASGIMRSENREKLCLVAQSILRNLDLGSMKLLEGRTLGEVLRFTSHALEAEGGRRLSPERFCDGLNLLSDAGLIYYRVLSAIKKDDGSWLAQSAEVALTYRFWQLLGFTRAQILRIKQNFEDQQLKKLSALKKAGQEVAMNRFKRLNKKLKRIQGLTNPSSSVKKDRSKEQLLSHITTRLCMSHSIEEVKKIISNLKNKSHSDLTLVAQKLGL